MPKSGSFSEFLETTTVALPTDLLTEARSLNVDLSNACARGLRTAIAEGRAARWLEENREALASYNDYVESNGIPLGEFREF